MSATGRRYAASLRVRVLYALKSALTRGGSSIFFFRGRHTRQKGAHADSAEEFNNLMPGSRSACVEERRELEEERRELEGERRELEEAVSDGAKLYKLDRSRYRHSVY